MDSLFYASGASGVLQPNPHLSAQNESELLNDYWIRNNLSTKRSKEQHAKRRVQRLGPLVSQSMSSLRGPSPIKPLQQAAAREDVDTSSVQEGSVKELQHRVIYGAAAKLEEELHALENLASHGREAQYDALKDSVAMNQIMKEVLALHGKLNEVVEDLEMEKRKDLSARVDFSNNLYARLFERMLAEILHLQRSKFQSTADTVLKLRQELAKVKAKEESGRDKVINAATSVAEAEMVVAGLRSDLAQAERRIEELNTQVRELDETRLQLQTTIEVNGRGISEREVKRMIRDARNEEVLKATKKQNETRKKFLKEVEQKVKEAVEVEKPVLSLSELAEKASKANDFKRPKVDSSIQTEVDESGIWDKQDGWTLPISGTIVARRRWREAIKFAKCPKCRGKGDFVALCARLLKAMMRGLPEVDKEAPRGKSGSTWIVPDDLVRFMSNLPRSVQAINPNPMSWVLRRVWHLCNEKKSADDIDEKLGYAMQSTPEFLIEFYLRLLPQRSDAELALYELFTSLQEHYKAHPMLHTFARFVGILDGLSVEEMIVYQKELLRQKQAKLEKTKKDAMRGIGVREKTALKFEEKEKKAEDDKRNAGKADKEELLKFCDMSFPNSVFQIYQYARTCLLEDYQGVYAKKIAAVKASVPLLEENWKKINKEANEWPVEPPAHVCVDSKKMFFVPFDRAVRVLSVMLSFLEDRLYQAALRTIETNAGFLNPDGSLYLLDGMHSYVRATMREFMQVESPDGADFTFMKLYEQQLAAGRAPPRDEEELGPMTEEEVEKDRNVLMVNLDLCLRIVSECMLLRINFVEKRLAEIFIEGDDNGDGVLSFKEFTTIVAVVAPHFNERRISRMFREALMLGNDDDSISPAAFVMTCKSHNLVQLVNLNDLRKGPLKALSLSDDEKRAKAFARAEEQAKLEALVTFTKAALQTPTQRRMSSILPRSHTSGSLTVGGSSPGLGGRKMSLRSLTHNVLVSKQQRQQISQDASVSSSIAESDESDVEKGGASFSVPAPAAAAPPESRGSDTGERRISTAGSPTQLALVQMYASATASPVDVENNSARRVNNVEGGAQAGADEQDPSGLGSSACSPGPVLSAAALKANVRDFVLAAAAAAAVTGEASPLLGRLSPASSMAASSRVSSASVESPAAPVSASAQLRAPSLLAEVEAEAAAAAAAHLPASPQALARLTPPAPSSLAPCPPAPAPPPVFIPKESVALDRLNEEKSKLTGAAMKEQLKARREARLKARLKETANINDSDDDEEGGP